MTMNYVNRMIVRLFVYTVLLTAVLIAAGGEQKAGAGEAVDDGAVPAAGRPSPAAEGAEGADGNQAA